MQTLDKHYYCCVHCKFVCKDQKYYLNSSAEKARYDLHHNDDQMYHDYLLPFVEQFFTSNEYILDFGSGPYPMLSKILMNKQCVVDLYDIYYANYPIGHNYDKIVCHEVLEHMQNPHELFKLVKHIKRGGRLIIRTQMYPIVSSKFANWSYKRDDTHISFYNFNVFAKLSKLYNLAIVHYDLQTVVFEVK